MTSYKSMNNYNQYGAGEVKGPTYNGPPMNVQNIPQYQKGVALNSLQHGLKPEQLVTGHFKMEHAYPAMKGANAVCAADFNFRDCTGKNLGKSQGVVRNPGQYSQTKYDNFL